MAKKPKLKETSRYKLNPGDFKSDRTLREDRGWLKMDVRWVITDRNTNSEHTVVGRTILPPGVGSMHALHRHPNAEEWEYVVHGVGIKHVGDESFVMFGRATSPSLRADVYHGLENGFGHRAADHALGLQRRAEPGKGRLHHPGGRRASRRRRRQARPKKKLAVAGLPRRACGGDASRRTCFRRGGIEMARTLIRNATIISVDPKIGDLHRGDILIDGAKIAAVARSILTADGAEVIDATNRIAIPGFIDTHRHTWEALLRAAGPDWSLGQYFTGVRVVMGGPLHAGGQLRREPARRLRGARFAA